MDLEGILESERLRASAESDRVLHGDDVAKDGPGGLVSRVALFGLGTREAALRQDETLDPGGRDGLCPEQSPGEDLEARQPRRIPIQRVDGPLGRRDRSGDRGGQRELQLGDRIGDERAVAEGATLGPAAGRGRVCRPGAGLVARHG